MNKYLVAVHSDFDGCGQSIKMIEVIAKSKNEALLLALSLQGWAANTMEDLNSIPDTSWSEPVLLDMV